LETDSIFQYQEEIDEVLIANTFQTIVRHCEIRFVEGHGNEMICLADITKIGNS